MYDFYFSTFTNCSTCFYGSLFSLYGVDPISVGGENKVLPGSVDILSGELPVDSFETLSAGDELESMTVSGSDVSGSDSGDGPVLDQLQVIHNDLLLIIALLLFFFAFRRIRSAVSGITGKGLDR